MIHVVGDSHIITFVGHTVTPPREDYLSNPLDALVDFSTYTILDMRAYHLNLGTLHHTGIRFFDLIAHLPKEEPILVSAGEIDCRRPILNAAYRTESTIELETSKCVERYLSGIKALRDAGWNLILYAPIPSRRVDYDAGPETGIPIPSHLTPEEWCLQKEEAVKIFDRLIKQSGFPVVSLVDWVFTNDLVNNPPYWRDPCHLYAEPTFPSLINEFAKIGLAVTFERKPA